MTKSMNEHLIGMYAMTLDSAVNLLRDVECEDCATLPHEAAKHPAWVLGHLSVAAGMAIEILGGASPVPKTWASWSGPGQDPTADRSMYPKLSELVDTLRADHLQPYNAGTRVRTPGLMQFVEQATTMRRAHTPDCWMPYISGKSNTPSSRSDRIRSPSVAGLPSNTSPSSRRSGSAARSASP